GSLSIEKYNEEHFPEFQDVRAREIGYVLSKEYWGRGMMPEAVKEVIRWLFEEMDLDMIFCGHFLWNTQSARVMEKCGFVHYAYDRFETMLGTVEDDEVCILKKEDWQKTR
ncbi:MAG: GNAT family N-acetyltransferase, partial [Solobacterium sp.]|nr:GNAT family N-acetyltransferase [Solobacterium sp.]